MCAVGEKPAIDQRPRATAVQLLAPFPAIDRRNTPGEGTTTSSRSVAHDLGTVSRRRSYKSTLTRLTKLRRESAPSRTCVHRKLHITKASGTGASCGDRLYHENTCTPYIAKTDVCVCSSGSLYYSDAVPQSKCPKYEVKESIEVSYHPPTCWRGPAAVRYCASLLVVCYLGAGRRVKNVRGHGINTINTAFISVLSSFLTEKSKDLSFDQQGISVIMVVVTDRKQPKRSHKQSVLLLLLEQPMYSRGKGALGAIDDATPPYGASFIARILRGKGYKQNKTEIYIGYLRKVTSFSKKFLALKDILGSDDVHLTSSNSKTLPLDHNIPSPCSPLSQLLVNVQDTGPSNSSSTVSSSVIILNLDSYGQDELCSGDKLDPNIDAAQLNCRSFDYSFSDSVQIHEFLEDCKKFLLFRRFQQMKTFNEANNWP
ncbi:hypothetical protein PR048_006807 [Dryococelus australis]|uniref:Uncharacterized protein n=1 Tax=Dryococelus australis TaxID=614101 RepID=A0ABQ9IBY9_9NEOP|nr:hypothetical protein PR048_006807 [Dryococelus australis]